MSKPKRDLRPLVEVIFIAVIAFVVLTVFGCGDGSPPANCSTPKQGDYRAKCE